MTPGDEPPLVGGPSPKDNGLRRMLMWTFAALLVSLLMAYIGVTLAIRYFDKP